MQALLAHAKRLGVTVHAAHLPKPWRGFYDADKRMVVYHIELTPVERRSVLAHELGHAFYDHRCSGDSGQEHAADLYAARLLIDPAEYARLEAMEYSSPWSIADELQLEVELVELFQRHALAKIHGATYAWPRLGSRQHAGRWSVTE
ncbi:MAG TPA: ImmA/IrrE family metallo-endopeptidase [Candidatus Lumbricidophila sp.]|nr:ImmA/IrrE family metallo-endopeptidase [Candidatus Lumbricidophila sp.]